MLTGCRPGELARLRRADIWPRDKDFPKRRERVFVIRNAKAGQDVRVVLSVPIIRALKIACRAHNNELVFPGSAQIGHRDTLPARGMMLRRTYRTIAADCETPPLIEHFLMSHAPEGISQRYVSELTLQSLPAMRRAQRKISARMLELLKMRAADISAAPWD